MTRGASEGTKPEMSLRHGMSGPNFNMHIHVKCAHAHTCIICGLTLVLCKGAGRTRRGAVSVESSARRCRTNLGSRAGGSRGGAGGFEDATARATGGRTSCGGCYDGFAARA
jgi:hypothetical protein